MIYCWIALDTRQPTTAAMDKATEWAQTFSRGSGLYILYCIYEYIYDIYIYIHMPSISTSCNSGFSYGRRSYLPFWSKFCWFSHLLLMEFVSPASFGDSLMAFEQSWKVEVQWFFDSPVCFQRGIWMIWYAVMNCFLKILKSLRIQCCFQFEGICMHL